MWTLMFLRECKKYEGVLCRTSFTVKKNKKLNNLNVIMIAWCWMEVPVPLNIRNIQKV